MFLDSNLLHQLARHIKNVAPIPDPTISYAGAIALMSGIAGRRFNTPTRTGLNQYVVILGRTGIGKEGAMTGIGSIFNSLCDPMEEQDRFIGPGYIASGQALLGEFDKRANMMCSIGEIGHLFRQLSKPQSSSDSYLLRMLLTLHNKSGVNDWLQSSSWADQKRNIPNIHAPCLSLLGDSTPRYFYKGMNEEMIQQGLYPRLLIFEVNKELPSAPPASYTSKIELNSNVSGRLQRLLNICRPDEDPTICGWGKGAREVLDGYFYECNKQRQKLSNTAAEDILTRSHLKALRLATLFAVCQDNNFEKKPPLISKAHALHAIKIEKFSSGVVLDRVASGAIGTETTERQKLNTLLSWFHNYVDVDSTPGAYEGDWARHSLAEIQFVRRRGIVPVSLIYPALSDHSIFEGISARRKMLSSLLIELVHHERLSFIERGSEILMKPDGKEITSGECYEIKNLESIGQTHVDWQLD